MEKCLVRWEAYQIKMKAQRWGEGDFPSQRKRLGANQVSEGSATKTTPTPLTSTASPRGPGRGQQAPPFVTETNPASPSSLSLKRALFLHIKCQNLLNHPLCLLKAVFSVPIKGIFSLDFFSAFTPGPPNSSIKA